MKTCHEKYKVGITSVFYAEYDFANIQFTFKIIYVVKVRITGLLVSVKPGCM